MMIMTISKGLKFVLLIHFVVGIVLGVVFLFFPEVYCQIFGISIQDHGVYRLIGAASLALGFSSYLAHKNADWNIVRLFIQMELVWLVSAIIGVLWWLLTNGPVAAWSIFTMFALFLAAFLYFYIKNR